MEHLNPYAPMRIENKEVKMYHIKKTNTIAYKSNFYTLPMSTYKDPGSKVMVKENDGVLEIYDLQNTIVCPHSICLNKGQTISNTNHRRDTSRSLNEMTDQTTACFTNKDLAMDCLKKIKRKLPRYLQCR